MKTFLNSTTLARRLNLDQRKLRTWIADGVLKPDAALVKGAGKDPSLLFDADRLPAIRKVLQPLEVAL